MKILLSLISAYLFKNNFNFLFLLARGIITLLKPS